ncbi:unnamed protein product [Tuber melanosporum]|uniref:(Perigord truffle) hypothetical protein n=1 Tax=Tuber melanosporum (strain Mel28) TaxID=656061 RepID=D5GEL1_TUBMM|nr:uncharacterized protein GSTUM_00006546001 [Tuber melanosporum]CAZ82954.1 unnamed protein product [Tuber melanosporum]
MDPDQHYWKKCQCISLFIQASLTCAVHHFFFLEERFYHIFENNIFPNTLSLRAMKHLPLLSTLYHDRI